MDAINDENKNTVDPSLDRYNEMRLSEAKHIVRKAYEAGVTQEVIIYHVDQEKCVAHAASKGEGNNVHPDRIHSFILNARKEWAYRGCFIIIDGGAQINRDWLAMAFLYRGITSHARSQGRLGITVTIAELLANSIGMPSRKSAVVDTLTNVPCLWIKDMQPKGTLLGTKDSDARTIFDGVLSGRESTNKPTIITIDGVYEDLNTEQEDRYGNKKGVIERYGSKFAEVMSNQINMQNNAWRFRAK